MNMWRKSTQTKVIKSRTCAIVHTSHLVRHLTHSALCKDLGPPTCRSIWRSLIDGVETKQKAPLEEDQQQRDEQVPQLDSGPGTKGLSISDDFSSIQQKVKKKWRIQAQPKPS